MDEETVLWEGSPSQILNLHVFIMCALLAGAFIGAAMLFRDKMSGPTPYILGGLALIPVVFAIARYLQLKCRRYQLTSERLRLRTGVLSRRTDEIELYRVKDYVLHEPFALRMFGLSNLVLSTTDDTNPRINLQAIHRGESLRDLFRKHVEICREKKRVHITEFEG